MKRWLIGLLVAVFLGAISSPDVLSLVSAKEESPVAEAVEEAVETVQAEQDSPKSTTEDEQTEPEASSEEQPDSEAPEPEASDAKSKPDENEAEDADVEEGGTSEQEVEPNEADEQSQAEQTKEKEGDKPKEKPPEKKKRVIGATAEILEKQSGLLFRARVDTGAKSCSLHVEEMEIVNEEDGWKDNIGKVVKFKVTNGSKKGHWIDRRIENYVIIKSSNGRERRYKVPVTLRWKGVEKKVLVTLTDRDGMDYPLLLGRNFLRGDFLVDVELDSTD